jgi:hypothetical protein
MLDAGTCVIARSLRKFDYSRKISDEAICPHRQYAVKTDMGIEILK